MLASEQQCSEHTAGRWPAPRTAPYTLPRTPRKPLPASFQTECCGPLSVGGPAGGAQAASAGLAGGARRSGAQSAARGASPTPEHRWPAPRTAQRRTLCLPGPCATGTGRDCAAGPARARSRSRVLHPEQRPDAEVHACITQMPSYLDRMPCTIRTSSADANLITTVDT